MHNACYKPQVCPQSHSHRPFSADLQLALVPVTLHNDPQSCPEVKLLEYPKSAGLAYDDISQIDHRGVPFGTFELVSRSTQRLLCVIPVNQLLENPQMGDVGSADGPVGVGARMTREHEHTTSPFPPLYAMAPFEPWNARALKQINY